jgi:hypothetical protein
MRRKIVAYVVATSFVAGVPFSWRGDYDAAHREAIRTGKCLAVLVTDNHNTTTRDLLARFTTESAATEKLRQSCIGVIVTKDVSHYPIEMYYTTRFPTLFLVDMREIFLCEPLYEAAVTPEDAAACLLRQ